MFDSHALKVAVTLKPGFFAGKGASEFTTISAAIHALRACWDGEVDIVYVSPGQSLSGVDAVMLPGGDDVHPAHYGRPDLEQEVEEPDPEHDAFELGVVRWATEQQLPVLGVCRGIQIINVATGGTLRPRLPRAEQHFSKKDTDGPEERAMTVHSLRVAPASKLWTVVEGETAEVNSIHRGGLDQLGSGLVATAWAEDGVIEAVEGVGEGWLHAVLFHPEDLCRADQRWLRLFHAFLSAAKEQRERRSAAAPAVA